MNLFWRDLGIVLACQGSLFWNIVEDKISLSRTPFLVTIDFRRTTAFVLGKLLFHWQCRTNYVVRCGLDEAITHLQRYPPWRTFSSIFSLLNEFCHVMVYIEWALMDSVVGTYRLSIAPTWTPFPLFCSSAIRYPSARTRTSYRVGSWTPWWVFVSQMLSSTSTDRSHHRQVVTTWIYSCTT